MANRQKMLDLNQQTMDQTNRLKAINRVAQQANETSTNVLRTLDHQREKIAKQIDMNKQINNEVQKANKKTNEMRNRALCMKCVLLFLIIVLFALLVGTLIYKLSKK